VGRAGSDAPVLHQALRHVLECGTETGALDEALDAWWALAAEGWQDEDRGWLGRRLGVAVARSSRAADAAALAGSLPDHERCLRFWSARGERELRRLAEAPVADLYGLWSRRALGLDPPDRVELPAPVPEVDPPRPVQLLITWGALSSAAEEWQRLRRLRGTSAAEVLAAARFESSRGRPDRAIRWLLAAYPDLGGTGIATAPVNVIHAYLPLSWRDDLLAASSESGVPPWLLAALARQESLFVAQARSPAGAVGVLQLIPSTARVHGRALGLGDRPDLTDPAVNLRLGAREIRHLIPRFGALEPALAAYNAGEARARRWWRLWPDAHRFTEAIPIPETYTYVRRVSFLAEAYRLVYHDLWEQHGQVGSGAPPPGSGG
jgi:soluble lytic murein transglycosylase